MWRFRVVLEFERQGGIFERTTPLLAIPGCDAVMNDLCNFPNSTPVVKHDA